MLPLITNEQYQDISVRALDLYEKAGIILTEKEKANLEIADFGLSDPYRTGLEIVTYINTDRVCAKEMVLLSYQTCPEHRHAPLTDKNYQGKEETFRCRYGAVYLYVTGEATPNMRAAVPKGVYTAFHEIILQAGEQYTIYPDTLHWFQAGGDGAVVSEFSTSSHDEFDIFTDPGIVRVS